MKTKETLQLLHNIQDYIFSIEISPRSNLSFKYEFACNTIDHWIYYNNVKDHSEEVSRKCSVKKMFLKFRKITGKHPCQSLFFSKVAS